MKSRRLILPLLLLVALLGVCSGAQAREGEFLKFSSTGTNPDGTPSTAAGGRPYELTQEFRLNQAVNAESKQLLPTESLKNVNVELPPGAVGNAEVLPHCLERELETAVGCPINSQVGIATTELQLVFRSTVVSAIYNMKPPPGMPVQFAFVVVAPRVHVDFHVRTGNDYGLTATIHNISATAPVWLNKFALWGVPADPSHDAARGGPSPEERVPLLSNPTSCEGPTNTGLSITTWQLPDTPLVAPLGAAPTMTDCNQVDFSPTVAVKPTTNLADSPSGLEFHLNLPQNEDPDGTAEALLRDAKVSLPSDLTINSAAANGLGSCTPEQIGYLGLRGEHQILRYPRPGTATFTVSREGATTAPISSIADVAEVTEALETLPGLAGQIRVEGGNGGWVVIFSGDLAGKDVPELTGEISDNRTETVAVTGTGGAYNLESGGSITGSEFEASFELGATFMQAANPTRTPKPGEALEGPGIAPGTVINNAFGSFLILNQGTTAKLENVTLHTALPYSTTAAELEEALQAMTSVGPNNATVTDLGTAGSTHSFRILFSRQVAGATPTFTASSTLTGPGAGVAVAVDPQTPGHPLEVATETEIKTGTPQFTEAPATCPDSSKIGTVRIDTPTLDHPLIGSIYLASQTRNPFGSLLAMYLGVNDPESGIVLKLPGLIEADPETGQLTATVSENPQLPFEDLQLEFFKGSTAPLKTGIACGTFQVGTEMTPWTAPEGAVLHPKDSYTITRGAGGGPCSKDEASAPNRPTFEAGTFEPTAGIYSPLTLKLSREDGTQQLTGIDTTLPKGLLARLAGVPYCSDAALAAAAAKTGHQELDDPSCPAASKVGTVAVSAGAGPTPIRVDGSAYLAGPYKGGALSLAVVTPAIAGPFDVGDVVVRNALFIDPVTTQVRAVSDRFPTILKGVPLSIRSILVNLDRDRFTRNPTSCNPLSVTGTLTTLSGQSTAVSNGFQVGDCGKLGFKPKLALTLKGGTKRRGHPALKAVLSGREGDANISRVAVSLPKSELLDNSHIKTVCTRVQFAASQCPAGSIYGFARAYTPLLDNPIEGPVYLRSANRLPDLVADLRGQINVVLDGSIDTTKAGGLRTTFEDVPDAPVSKFVLELDGGKKGLLENSTDLCAHEYAATALIDGQNTKTFDQSPVLKNSCKKGKKKSKKGQRKKQAHKHGAGH